MTNLQITPDNRLALTTERAERIRDYVDAGRANETKRAYGAAWRDFTRFFAHSKGYNALPASPEAVCDYLAHCAQHGESVSLIEQRRAAIRFAHRGQVNPCADDRVTETMRGIRRKVGTANKRRYAATTAQSMGLKWCRCIGMKPRAHPPPTGQNCNECLLMQRRACSAQSSSITPGALAATPKTGR